MRTLCERKILGKPLLYLSYYLKAHRSEYYDRLTGIRNNGDWEGWLRFFLRGVYEVSQASTKTARAILELREKHRGLIFESTANSVNGLKLLDRLFEVPMTSIRAAKDFMGVSYVTASTVIQQMEEMGILKELTGQKRNKVYRYDPYIDLFSRQAISLPGKEENDGSEIRTIANGANM